MKRHFSLKVNNQGLSWADAGGPARGWLGPARPARPGPSILYLMGRGPARPIKFYLVGLDPARPVKFSEDGPRPGPVNQRFRGWAAARPGPAHYMAARPMKHGLYIGRPDNFVGRPVDLSGRPMGRPMCCPVLNGACAYADAIFKR